MTFKFTAFLMSAFAIFIIYRWAETPYQQSELAEMATNYVTIFLLAIAGFYTYGVYKAEQEIEDEKNGKDDYYF